VNAAPQVQISRIVVDGRVSHYELLDRLSVNPGRGEYVRTFEKSTDDSWGPADDWYKMWKCVEKAGHSKRRLARCGDLHLLNPTLDILVENSSALSTVLSSLSLVLEDWNAPGGDSLEPAGIPTAVIKTSATYKFKFAANAFDVAQDGKWYIGRLDLNPPLNSAKGTPARFNLEIAYPKLTMPTTARVHLEVQTTDGQKVRSKPFVLFFP
jgi:hypothetical protein